MNDPHASARYVLRRAGNDAITLADRVESAYAAVLDLWGPAGAERLMQGVTPADRWAADKRELARELFASADALAPSATTNRATNREETNP